MIIRRTLLAAAALGLASALPARAQDYPSRTITIVAGAAAGGPTDVITRLVAEAMAKHLPQPVVVENIGPAHVGAQRVAQARPDGYTLLMTNVGMAAGATLFRRLSFDTLNGFAPLGLVSDAAMTIIAKPGFPAENLAGLVEQVRQRGEALNLGTAGLGSAANLCGLLLQQAAGNRVTIVGFRGTAPAITELMAGRLDLLCDQATNTVPFIRENRVRAYGVTSPARLPGLPDIPTTAEAGVPAITMSTWHGLYAPAGTPEEVQQRINAALLLAMQDERLRTRFAELVTDPATPERASLAFHRRYHAEEIARWRPIIQAAGSYAD
ncbi:tripartite tricarboxylate transporter substrate-binding protein [Neoroseomonas oryzicola]|uniref:Tripartite tricarboxylate transporter substrate binding protein BugD n=1 Tax=Neoroseomonas oryzicola TaxID=535904 RepID=A0A9X9WG19_9PROT|nr:tripartite tricarboxylate transporter substrate-binding protein [Neoroseomonas oryzicola]MBR0659279.1 tripartite tricarboxylate transporter substrate binding protein BugD [Neoroseomonas oryzicola]NKE15587.1 tripartite tricarboxylate transporter substrate binding protein BugD [Neoroseomonas oryzicola]